MTNRDLGLQTLKLWFDDSIVRLNHSFEEIVAYYDSAHPSMITSLGQAVKFADLSQDRIKQAFKQLQYPADVDPAQRLPLWDSFFTALSGETVTLRFEDYQAIAEQTATQTVSTVEKAAVVGVGIYAIWLIGGFAALYFLQRSSHA